MEDAIDKAAGLVPGDAIHEARRFRPEFVDGAQLCQRSVLQPSNDQGLGPDLRVALACRMARTLEHRALVADYANRLDALHPPAELTAVAEGATVTDEPLATLVRHVDLITTAPRQATAGDIEKLVAAGLTNPQIVALSELIAFVNFEARVAAALQLMVRQ